MVLFLLAAAPTFAGQEADIDGDFVLDADDLCPWSDDRVDLDGNGHPDCDESDFPFWGMDDNASVSGWHGYLPSYGLEDANSYAASGSIVKFGQGPVAHQLTTCLPVDTWRTYTIAAQARADLHSGVPTQIRMFAVEYSEPGCTGVSATTTTLDMLAPPVQSMNPGWKTEWDALHEPSYTPRTWVRSVRVEFRVNAQYGIHRIYFDNVLFRRNVRVIDPSYDDDEGFEDPGNN